MKIVDHDQRRDELARAVWQVIQQSGMRGATVRAVAKQAGVSPGSLRHYFSDQAGLLRFAAERMTEQVVMRIHSRLMDTSNPQRTAVAILMECLPGDGQRRVECAVWLECLLQSRYDLEMSRMRLVGFAGARHVCRVAWALYAGLEPPTQGDALAEPHETSAALLHTFLDGLTLQSSVAEDVNEDALVAQVEAMLYRAQASL